MFLFFPFEYLRNFEMTSLLCNHGIHSDKYKVHIKSWHINEEGSMARESAQTLQL
jgi:hypothetical protein